MNSEIKQVNPAQIGMSQVIEPGMKFSIAHRNYAMDRFGIIHQLPPYEMQKYDPQYVQDRYDVIPESVLKLSHLRAGYVLAYCGNVRKVLDIGYGNGGFLNAMKYCGADCAGSDVSGYPVPEGCRFVPPASIFDEEWDLVTFYDSLEHFEHLDLFGKLRAQYIAITAPCVPERVTVGWLANWKHLRPGEHLHHFSIPALRGFMRGYGYNLGTVSHVEDMIRRPAQPEPNIFTAIFHREQY